MADDCPRDCPMARRIAALEETEKRHGETHKEIFGRINKLETENAVQNANHDIVMDMLKKVENKNDKLLEKVDTIKECVAAQLNTINELNERGKNNQKRLDELEKKPGKKWENMTDKFSGGIIGGIASLLVGGIILLLAFASGLIQLGG